MLKSGCARSEVLLASCDLITQLVLPGQRLGFGFKSPEELEESVAGNKSIAVISNRCKAMSI